MMRRILGIAAAALGLAGSASAHPHIFIDAGVHAIFDDQGQLAAVRVIWTYDDFYSLLVVEDRQLDGDYDGKLTPEEEAALTGFDMGWMEGFAGDTYALYQGEKIGLSGPADYTAAMVDGRIVTTHVRALDRRIDLGAEPVIFQVYDPDYYTAYQVTLPARVEGREGCTGEVFVPKLDDQSQVLLDALAEVGADMTLEEAGIPAVGAQFAEEVRFTCDAPS